MLFKYSLPLKEASPFFLSWITMLMTFVAALVLFASISLTNIISHWNSVISGSLTIQQPTYDLLGVSRQDEAEKELDAIAELLKQQPFVTSYHILTKDEMDKLMSPWLGELGQSGELPIPYLIDVELDKNTPFSLDMFKTEVNAVAAYAKVDSHRIWLSHLMEIAGGIQKTIFVILLMLVLTTAFTVIYTTRSSLLVQANTLRLLQMMGAHDSTLALAVAKNSFVKGLIGGVTGFLLSLPIVGIVITLVDTQYDHSLFGYGALSSWQWIVISSLPLVVSALAFLTAFFTGMKKLRSF